MSTATIESFSSREACDLAGVSYRQGLLWDEDIVPMRDPMHDLLDAAENDLETAEKESASHLSETHRLHETIERLEGRETTIDRFEQAIQRAHHQARHEGLWTVCPHPVCRSLEDFLHAEAKDRTG